MLRPLVAVLVLSVQFVVAGLVTIQADDPSIQYSNNQQWSHSEACGGTEYSFGIGQSFSFRFTGTSISIVGTSDQYGGIVTITLDGAQYIFNRYSSQGGYDLYDPQCSTLFYQNSNLAPTQHYLLVNHTSSIASTHDNQFFEWQYLQYFQTENQGNVKSKSSNVAAIAGGVGGGVGAILIIVLLWWYFKPRPNRPIIFPVDLTGDEASPSGLGNAIVEPFVPPPQNPPQPDPTRRQSRVLQKRSSSSSFKQMSNANMNVASMPYINHNRSASQSSIPRQGPNRLRRSSIAKSPSTDDQEFNPYALATGTRPTSMTEFPRHRPADRPLSGDWSVAGSSSYGQPGSSRGTGSQVRMMPEKGIIGVMNPDAPSSSVSAAVSPRLPEQVTNQLPALSDTDMARLAAQVATMLQPTAAPLPAASLPDASPQAASGPPPRPDDGEEAPPEYSQIARRP